MVSPRASVCVTRYMLELTQQPGDVVRYGPNRISVNTNTGLREIYGFRANTHKSRNFYNVFIHFFHSDSTLTVIDPTEHGKRRRILAQAVSGGAIQAMEDQILVKARLFCGSLQGNAGWSSARNISTSVRYLTFDILSDIALGRSFDMLTSETHRHIIGVLSDGVQGLNFVSRANIHAILNTM